MKPTHSLNSPKKQLSPVIFDSPHSGTDYPDDFLYICDRHDLRRAEDMYVDELFDHVLKQGAPLLKAHFPRSYIDVNRKTISEISDLKRAFGLFRTRCTPAKPIQIYDRALTPDEVKHRIKNYYTPYHKRLFDIIQQTKKQFGFVWHLNCHSMPSRKTTGEKNPYDFILSNSNHKTGDAQILHAMKAELEGMGYTVGLNIVGYRGAEIVKKFGQPANDVHSIQLEINRGLYMDEESFAKTRNYSKLKRDLEVFTRKITQLSLQSAPIQKVENQRKPKPKFK